MPLKGLLLERVEDMDRSVDAVKAMAIKISGRLGPALGPSGRMEVSYAKMRDLLLVAQQAKMKIL